MTISSKGIATSGWPDAGESGAEARAVPTRARLERSGTDAERLDCARFTGAFPIPDSRYRTRTHAVPGEDGAEVRAPLPTNPTGLPRRRKGSPPAPRPPRRRHP